MSNNGYQPKEHNENINPPTTGSKIYTPEPELANLIKQMAILVSALTDDVIRMNADIEELKKAVK